MLIRHSSFYLVSWILPAAVSFGALLLFTRLLTPEDYGAYATVVIAAALIYTLSLNWICASALRLYPASSDPSALLSTLLCSYLIVMAAVAGGAGVTTYVLTEPGDRILVWIGFALVAANGWLEINLHLLRARLKSELYALANILRSACGAACGVLLVLLGCGGKGALLGVLAGALIPGLWLTLRYWKLSELSRPQRAIVANLAGYGLPLSVSYALEAVYWYSDRMLLASLLGPAAVGLYAVGFDMADKTVKGIMAALGSGAGLPLAISRLESGGEEAARHQLRHNLVFLLTGGLPAAAGLIAIVPTLVTFLGSGFQADARQLIPIITAATFLSALRGNYFDHAFYLGRRTTAFVVVMAGGGVVNAGLCLLLIPRMGIMGAAYATLSAYALSLVLGVAVGRHAFRLPIPWADIGKIAVATALMVIAVLAVPEWAPVLRLASQVLLGGLVYALLILLLNVGDWRAALLKRLGGTAFGRAAAREAEPGAVTGGDTVSR